MSRGGRLRRLGDPAVLEGVSVLKSTASGALIRRTVTATVVSILPMSLVVAYDMFLLNLLYGVLLRFLPAGVATYVTLNLVVVMSFIFAATYATIPLLLARRSAPPQRVA
jgi:hypothetical protein